MEITMFQKYILYFNHLQILATQNPINPISEILRKMNYHSLFHMKHKKPRKNILGLLCAIRSSWFTPGRNKCPCDKIKNKYLDISYLYVFYLLSHWPRDFRHNPCNRENSCEQKPKNETACPDPEVAASRSFVLPHLFHHHPCLPQPVQDTLPFAEYMVPQRNPGERILRHVTALWQGTKSTAQSVLLISRTNRELLLQKPFHLADCLFSGSFIVQPVQTAPWKHNHGPI